MAAATHETAAFKVTDDEVGVQWDDGAFEATISADGGRAVAAAPDASPILDLIASAMQLVQPDRYTKVFASMQYVVPLKGEYLDRRRKVGSNLLAVLAADLGLTDFAMLVDADTDQFLRQMEFGIVSADEIPTRLSRELGRMSSSGRMVPKRHWEKRKLPPVALFIDTNWRGRKMDFGSGGDWLYRWWSEAMKDAERSIEAIIRRVEAE